MTRKRTAGRLNSKMLPDILNEIKIVQNCTESKGDANICQAFPVICALRYGSLRAKIKMARNKKITQSFLPYCNFQET